MLPWLGGRVDFAGCVSHAKPRSREAAKEGAVPRRFLPRIGTDFHG
jgi:hypothetical protein